MKLYFRTSLYKGVFVLLLTISSYFARAQKADEPLLKDAKAYAERGFASYKQGKYTNALNDYSKAIGLDPKNADYYALRASCYLFTDHYELALTDINYALSFDPNNTEDLFTRGDIYSRMKKFDSALKDYGLVIEKSRSADVFRARAEVYIEKGSYDSARADLTSMIQMNQKEPRSYYFRALLMIMKEEPDMAITDLNKAIELNQGKASFEEEPGNNLYSIRAAINHYLGNYNESIADILKASEGNDTTKSANMFLVTNMVRSGNIEGAKLYYQKHSNVNKVRSDSRFTFFNHYVTALADGLFAGKYDVALTELKAADESYSLVKSSDNITQFERKYEYTDALFLEGLVLEKLERLDEAQIAYQQALLLNKYQSDLRTALQRIENKKAIAVQSDKTPPEIQLIHPKPSRSFDIISDNSESDDVYGRAIDPSGIAEIKINDVIVQNDNGHFDTTLFFKPGDNLIKISATDKHGNTGEKIFTIKGNVAKKEITKPENPNTLTDAQPKYYAILIAENHYLNPGINDLPGPINDARALKSVLETYYSFDPQNIDTLYDSKGIDIWEHVISKCRSLKENDNLLIFYAGHGTVEKYADGTMDGYWVPVDAKKGNPVTYISADQIIKGLKASSAKHILIIADACFAGSFVPISRSMGDLAQASTAINELYKRPSRTIMTSGYLEVPDNSQFAYYLRKNLIENTEKYLTSEKLFSNFKEAVINSTDNNKKPNIPEYALIPGFGDNRGQFVFIKK